MSNHEIKDFTESVDVLVALQRTKFAGKNDCVRSVVKNPANLEQDIAILEAKLKVMGGEWRIHKTVNKRDVEKARKWLIKHLIDYPEKASFIDSLWRTALLQPDCIYGEKRFMFDVDTKESDKLKEVESLINVGTTVPYIVSNYGQIETGYIPPMEKYETPNGFHYITKPFDTRKVCELPYVTLQRDGYYYIKTVGVNNDTANATRVG